MNKIWNTAIFLSLGILILSSNVTNSRNLVINTQIYPTGIKILVFHDLGYGPNTDGYSGLTSNYTSAGNTVTVVTPNTWNFLTDDLNIYDVLFTSISGFSFFNAITTPEVAVVKNWFDTGDKLLWIGGWDDLVPGPIFRQINPLLEAIGTPLRFDAGGLKDPIQNDGGQEWRVMANETGVNSPLVDYVTTGFNYMSFFSATTINYWDGSKITDLRNVTLPSTLDIVINSSQAAIVLDQDSSNGDDDYYAYVDTLSPSYHGINGLFPLLVVDRKASSNSNSMLVLSGSRVFADSQNMYGRIWPTEPGLAQQGSQVIDNILTYYFVETLGDISSSTFSSTTTETSTSSVAPSSQTSSMTNDPSTSDTSDSSDSSDSSLNNLNFLMGFVIIIAIIRKMKK